MNIIIPLGGKGERFKSEDYHYPKILTNVLGKSIITWVIDSLNITKDDAVTLLNWSSKFEERRSLYAEQDCDNLSSLS